MRLQPIPRLADHRDIRSASQQGAHTLPNDKMIVDDESSDGILHDLPFTKYLLAPPERPLSRL